VDPGTSNLDDGGEVDPENLQIMLGNEVKRNFQVGLKLCPDVARALSLEENKKNIASGDN
jgi:hypothetical protein